MHGAERIQRGPRAGVCTHGRRQTPCTGDSELWRQRIYDVLRDPGLESYVQDVFIKTLEVVNGRLLIRNERGEVFLLDPATRAVTRKP